MFMKSESETALNQLVGLPLWAMGGAGSMQWFEFGECREIIKPDESSHLTGEWALHVFCAWRICDSTQILVASYDRCRKIEILENYVENFGRDEKFDAHLFGESQAFLRGRTFFADQTDSLCVSEVAVDNANGFRLSFETGFFLDVFPDCSIEGFEHWRLLKTITNSADFIVSVRK